MTTECGHRLKTFSLRMEKTLRKELEASARANGNTLTDEINHRLENSLEAQSKQDAIAKRLNKESKQVSKKLDMLLSQNA